MHSHLPSLKDAKAVLDDRIARSRTKMYKPLQIAELLYAHRQDPSSFDPLETDSFRLLAHELLKRIERQMFGKLVDHNRGYMDHLFIDPFPKVLKVLSDANEKNPGIVETYIYGRFAALDVMLAAIDNELSHGDEFAIEKIFDQFSSSTRLRSSVDKIYEIAVYALFDTVVRHVNATVSLKIGPCRPDLIHDFADFLRIVLGIENSEVAVERPARLYRFGKTNASDAGIDMWANFGPAVQVKHISLNPAAERDIESRIEADEVIIVCKESEVGAVEALGDLLSKKVKIRGIITKADIVRWYNICLSEKYRSENLARDLRRQFHFEFRREFPRDVSVQPILKERGYEIADLTGIWSIDDDPRRLRR